MESVTNAAGAHAVDALDHDATLDELLRGVAREKLHASLRVLLGAPVRVTDPSGVVLLADSGTSEWTERHRASVRIELETIGFVESPADAGRTRAAADLVEVVLASANRYRLAAAMHTHTVERDYEELQRRHDDLRESETRYRELNVTLERRVADQVRTLDAAQRQLYQTEKLASLGQLAAGMAHEINNPMGFVHSNLTTGLGYVEALIGFAAALRSGSDGDDLREQWRTRDLDFAVDDLGSLLHESLAGADRVVRIVAALKGFTRVDQAEVDAVDVNAMVRNVCEVVRAHAAHSEIRLELQALPPVRGRAAHLSQLLFNVLLNAAQAIPAGRRGAIVVTTAGAGGEARIEVRDNGSGIPADVLPRVFDPFFTTKDVGKGTGLGLTVCNDIARAHGGRLAIESEAGAGTAVRIHLPAGGGVDPSVPRAAAVER